MPTPPDEAEQRGWCRREGVAIALALSILALLIVALAFVALPALLAGLVDAEFLQVLNIVRWPALVLLFALAVGALYIYALSRRRPQAHWASCGTLAAMLLRILAATKLSLCVSHARGFSVFMSRSVERTGRSR